MALFSTKSMAVLQAEAGDEANGLKRALGATNLVSLGIGAIIGTGIFVLTGPAAALNAGPAVVFSFILAAIACVFAGLCYSEFAAMIPIAGSAYTYGYATLGEFIAWIIGWDLILEYAFGAATVASGWSGYVLSFLQDFGIRIPTALAGPPGTEFVLYNGHWDALNRISTQLAAAGVDPATLPHQTSAFNLVAFLGIAICTTILVIGIKESASFNNFIVLVKILVLLVFIGLGAYFLAQHPTLTKANWTPFLPPNTGAFGSFGWSGVARAAGVIFFAYIGFDAVSTAAQEAKNPQRDMPIGILGSLVICTILYILVAMVLTGLVKYNGLNVADPIAIGIDKTGVGWGSFLVKLGAIAGLSSTMIVMLLGQSRIFFSMGRDGLLPKWASAVHPKFRTPYVSSIFVGVFVALFAALIPVDVLGQLVSIGTLLAFIIVCAGVWVLRRRDPERERPFRTPWVPFVPIMGIVVSLVMMLALPLDTWVRLIVWMAVGFIVYFAYSRHHSVVGRGESVLAGLAPSREREVTRTKDL